MTVAWLHFSAGGKRRLAAAPQNADALRKSGKLWSACGLPPLSIRRAIALIAIIFFPAFVTAADAPKRIIILGDSIAAGYGVDPDEAYPALLQRKIDAAKLPFMIVNAGVSGDTTADGLRRVNWVLKQPVDILVLELGGNDGLRG